MRTIRTLALVALAIGFAQASPLFNLDPSSGAVSGPPGETVGWGFDLTADSTDWTTIIGTVVLGETDPSVGVFTDLIGPQGGPDNGVLAPGSPDWIQTFDADTFTGFGSYAIDPGALLGQSDSGTFLVQYELFNDDPATCGSCFVSSGYFLEGFTVNTAAATPEPSGFGTMLAGGGLIALASWVGRRRTATRTRQLTTTTSGKILRPHLDLT